MHQTSTSRAWGVRKWTVDISRTRRGARRERLPMSNIAIARRAIAPVAQISPQIGRRALLLCALGMALTVAGAWYGYGWWTVGRFIESTDDAYARGHVTAISPHVA